MIKIIRSSSTPKCLLVKGAAQTVNDCADYDAGPDEYRFGRKLLNKFNNKIYTHSSVKVALVRAHHGKCCYCEKKYDPANLHVEHFRPKGGVRQRRNQKDDHPGYFWLAYAWENLLLACHQCNSVNKGTLFPLANPGIRPPHALSHHYDISLEEPLFIDPGSPDDPRDHIRFVGFSPVALTPRGRTTIREIGLRKSTHISREGRMAKYKHLRMCLEVVEAHRINPSNANLRKLVVQARKDLKAAIKPEAEYSSMARDLISSWRP